MQFNFGSGALWGERTDVVGSGIGPRQFGVLQDVQVDFDWTTKPLYGQFQFPVVIARGQGKITCKAKVAQVQGLLFSDLFFGTAPGIGQYAISQLEPAIVPLAPPFGVTVANAFTYNDDLGVVYATTGGRFNRVTTPSLGGLYTVNLTSGVYTFSPQDAGASLMISYSYSKSAIGAKLTITNQFMGMTPTFKATFYTTYAGSGQSLHLNACTSNKLSMPAKIDNWTIYDIEFEVMADASGTIGFLSTVE